MSYDNSTRGLDASTALDYAKSLRVMTDIFNMTTFVSIYQAGEGIYDQFDKVLVIDQGKQVYFGPAKEARGFFVGMGYKDFPRQTTADYLTGCTDPNERKFGFEKDTPEASNMGDDDKDGASSSHSRPPRAALIPVDENGLTNGVPSTPDSMAAYYNASPIAARVSAEVDDYNKSLTTENPIEEFRQAVLEAKGRGSRKDSPYQVGFLSQVWAIAVRHVQLKCVFPYFLVFPLSLCTNHHGLIGYCF